MLLIPQVKWAIFLTITCVASTMMLIAAIIGYEIIVYLFLPIHSIRTAISFDFDFMDNQVSKYPLIVSAVAIPDLPLSKFDYDVSLELSLPRDEHNKRVGNFMTRIIFSNTAEMYTSTNNTNLVKLACDQTQISQPVSYKYLRDNDDLMIKKMGILPYRSQLIEVFDNLFFLPLYLLGYSKEMSTVSIQLLRRVSRPKRRYKYVFVDVNKALHIESASMVWTVRLVGLRYFMYRNPILAFFVGVSFIWFWEAVFALAAGFYVYNLGQIRIEPQIRIYRHPRDNNSKPDIPVRRSRPRVVLRTPPSGTGLQPSRSLSLHSSFSSQRSLRNRLNMRRCYSSGTIGSLGTNASLFSYSDDSTRATSTGYDSQRKLDS